MLRDLMTGITKITLVQLNLWLDILQWLIIGGGAGAALAEFSLVYIVKGRFKERWVDKKWSYIEELHEPWHEEFPMPTRVWHWINLIAFAIFISTGFYIRYPFLNGGREIARYLHFVAMYAAAGAWVYRFGWFMMTTGDWKYFVTATKEDVVIFFQVLKYYVGMVEHYPHKAKYHLMQRGGYAAMMLAVFPIQAYTGFALVWPRLLLGPFVAMGVFGDVAVAAAWARWIHALLMRVFFAFTIVHASLAIMYAFPNLLYFWFGIATPMPHLEHGHGHGGDDEGHGDEHGGGH